MTMQCFKKYWYTLMWNLFKQMFILCNRCEIKCLKSQISNSVLWLHMRFISQVVCGTTVSIFFTRFTGLCANLCFLIYRILKFHDPQLLHAYKSKSKRQTKMKRKPEIKMTCTCKAEVKEIETWFCSVTKKAKWKVR